MMADPRNPLPAKATSDLAKMTHFPSAAPKEKKTGDTGKSIKFNHTLFKNHQAYWSSGLSPKSDDNAASG